MPTFLLCSNAVLAGSEKEQELIEEVTPKIDKGKGKAKAVEPTEEEEDDDDDEDDDDEDEEDDLVRIYINEKKKSPLI